MQFHKSASRANRSPLVLGLASLVLFGSLTSCSGGSSSSGSTAVAAIAGDYNFFWTSQTGDCLPIHSSYWPLEIIHTSGNNFLLRLGWSNPTTDSVFDFSGIYDPATNQLSVSGMDTVASHSIQILSASWQFNPAINEVSGSMQVIKTPVDSPSCTVSYLVDAYREDSTQSHELVVQGGGTYTFYAYEAFVLDSDTPANIGSFAEGSAVFWPQRAGLLRLILSGHKYGLGVDAFRDVSLDGLSVNFPSANVSGDLQILSSDLTFNAIFGTIFGTIDTFDVMNGNETLEVSFEALYSPF